MADPNDPRWGGYVPWFLRYSGHVSAGDWITLFSRLSQRLNRLLLYNEVGIPNTQHFMDWLETESFQRFTNNPQAAPNIRLSGYFKPGALRIESQARANGDEIETKVKNLKQRLDGDKAYLYGSGIRLPIRPGLEPTPSSIAAMSAELLTLTQEQRKTRPERDERHYRDIVIERLSVLETLLRLVPGETAWKASLIQDIRRFFAESNIPLDVKEEETAGCLQLVPLDEPLLQSGVVGPLLPRLHARFPERAKELTAAYHDFLHGKDGDSIFLDAFKSLEQLARDLIVDSTFRFDKSHLDKHFPLLHGTIHQTLIRLDGHRGDRAAHGKNAPSPCELRYLLFAICNAALLLLDYPSN